MMVQRSPVTQSGCVLDDAHSHHSSRKMPKSFPIVVRVECCEWGALVGKAREKPKNILQPNNDTSECKFWHFSIFYIRACEILLRFEINKNQRSYKSKDDHKRD